MTVSVIDTGPNRISRSVLVNAPVSELFAIVADPRRHHELDGSGTVRATVSGPPRLAEGATFSVNMKAYGLPYRITSKVTAFEENRLIEWRHPVGHRWRWQFTPESAGSTRVTETFDYSEMGRIKAAIRYYDLIRAPKSNTAGIEATLTRLQARYAPDGPTIT
ncbi:SRPBCC family protein [Candidatus Frankia alpina]|uniref:Dimethyladenosine transferase n=1 Tax=Candidatus Frankia alpina TaxID=2699483 RepID=A0A4S5BY10_9ACTN|nr:SRPBCC family protein [Candidatus Frankia alpina]THJ37549.1 dimethyladenosine transferase [Candidatus Frankia alpina]